MNGNRHIKYKLKLLNGRNRRLIPRIECKHKPFFKFTNAANSNYNE